MNILNNKDKETSPSRTSRSKTVYSSCYESIYGCMEDKVRKYRLDSESKPPLISSLKEGHCNASLYQD